MIQDPVISKGLSHSTDREENAKTKLSDLTVFPKTSLDHNTTLSTITYLWSTSYFTDMFRPITSLYLGNNPTREVELIIKCRTEAQKRKNAQDYTVILKTTTQGHPISKFSTLSDA